MNGGKINYGDGGEQRSKDYAEWVVKNSGLMVVKKTEQASG